MVNWPEGLLDLLFPPRCEICKKMGKEILCSECMRQIKFMRPQMGVICATAYVGIMREALHCLKFKKRKKLVNPLGVLLVNYLSALPNFDVREIDLIVPIPLHPRRLRQRGFNQSQLLANAVSKYFGVPEKESLLRIRDTKPPFDLSRKERLLNIVGAFKVSNPSFVSNKRVLLVDDIYTTGATMTEGIKVLKAAGAKRIEILTMARAIED
jgi:ComF family protein